MQMESWVSFFFFKENKDYTQTEKASTEHCAVSVEESRMKYSCVDFSSGKISSKLVNIKYLITI